MNIDIPRWLWVLIVILVVLVVLRLLGLLDFHASIGVLRGGGGGSW